MESLRVRAHGKINWALKVMGTRPDGYHELDTLFQSISLYDELTLAPAAQDRFTCRAAYVPQDESNLAIKALFALRKRAEVPPVSISLEKHIPVAGGLAGGSADAAGVIKGLNCLFGLGLDEEELRRVGVTVGADVPFCLMGGAARARGIGEKLTAVKGDIPVALALLNPGRGLSTPRIFQTLCQNELDGRPLDELEDAFSAGDLDRFIRLMQNDLYPPALSLCPQIRELIDRLLEAGALGAAMSGSGPTVFGLFPDLPAAQRALETCRAPVKMAAELSGAGVEILTGPD